MNKEDLTEAEVIMIVEATGKFKHSHTSDGEMCFNESLPENEIFSVMQTNENKYDLGLIQTAICEWEYSRGHSDGQYHVADGMKRLLKIK
jgi:hypothetical protein